MKKTVLLPLFLLLSAATALAQQPAGDAPAQPTPATQTTATADTQPPTRFAPNTIIPAELSKSVDAKKLKVGDPIEAKSTVDMLSNGKIVMPRNTRLVGHVTSVKAHSKDSPDSTVGIAFDRMVMKDGHEMPLQASLQALAPPLSAFNAGSTSGAPAGGLMAGGSAPGGSSAGSMGGSRSGGGGGGGSGGGSSQSSYPSSNGMPISPDGPMAHGSSAGALSPSAQGVVGIRDLSLSSTPQASVLSSGTKNVHLDGGTQLILKVQ